MELLNLTYCLLYKSKRQFGCFTEEECEDTKMLIRIRRSKKDRQYNGQEKKDKQPATKDTHKTKDRVARTPIKTVLNSGAPEGWAVPAQLVGAVVLL